MKKRLSRSVKDKIIFGVAGGIGTYLDVDPVFVRIAFVLGTFLNGIGLIVYIVCAIIMPIEVLIPDANIDSVLLDEISHVNKQKDRISKEKVFGGFLIVIGSLFLLHNLIPSFEFSEIVPLLLIAFGVWLLISSIKKEESLQ
ncbi:MAG: PspC domain-containing protein [Ignavibacteriaceae bacterium]